MTVFDFSTFHSASDMVCLSSDTVLVLADPAKWIVIWRQISSPVTAPESEFDVRIILLTMTFGSPEVAWSNVYLIKKSPWAELILFSSSFPLGAVKSMTMSWISVVRLWPFWSLDFVFCLIFCSVCFLSDQIVIVFLDLFDGVGKNAREHDICLNDVLWGCRSCEQRYEFLIVSDC